jgi:ferredoxin
VCAEIAPEVFFVGDDDLAYLCEEGPVHPGDAAVIVPHHLEAVVLEAADECPAACIAIAVVR